LVLAGERASFFGVDYVIRDCRYLRRPLRPRAERAKGLNDGHDVPPSYIVKIAVEWGKPEFY